MKFSEVIFIFQVDSTKNITDYDEATQASIRKIVFEHREKVRPLKDSFLLEIFSDMIFIIFILL
jgi:hypothetical protein